jgi:hypothetical protein
MILEGLVTTLDEDGAPHLAPMGPEVSGTEFDEFILKPFQSSHTCQNLLRHSEGVLHVTDDSLLFARSAIGRLDSFPAVRPAEQVRGVRLVDCVRWIEFEVTAVDDSTERLRLAARVRHAGSVRQWFGFNRGKHAVIEAAILATRVHLLPRNDILREFATFDRIVAKTGGPDESAAMRLLTEFVGAGA